MSCDAIGTVTHRFLQGLRCDDQLRYVTVEARGAQMLAALPLSWTGTSSGDESGRLCLLRAAAIVARTRARGLAATAPSLSDPIALAQWCSQAALRVAAKVAAVSLAELGPSIQTAMADGGACGVLLLTKTEARWVFVTGTEADGADGHVRALLLLDPGRAMPWCAGYNARIELRRFPASAQELVWRTIEGEQGGVRLRALLTVKRSGS